MKILSEKIVNTKLYGGTIDILTGYDDFESEVVFDKSNHKYFLNGEEIPSVTSLLSDNSYEGVPRKVLEAAALRGTLIHKEIEEWLKKGKEPISKEANNFIKLFNENKELFNQRAIFDIKTYSDNDIEKQKKTYEQTKMYGKGVEYLTGIEPEKHYEIWLNKDNYALIDLSKINDNNNVPLDVIEQIEKIEKLEKKIEGIKTIQEQISELKKNIYNKMIENNVKSWETPKGIKITVVEEVKPTTKTISVFNEEKFKEENKSLYANYLEKKEQTTNGRSGYLKITMPKGE